MTTHCSKVVTSANAACGHHAGNPSIMVTPRSCGVSARGQSA
ncbi:LamB/YcsF family protein [Geodermatophilus sp. URMC 62]